MSGWVTPTPLRALRLLREGRELYRLFTDLTEEKNSRKKNFGAIWCDLVRIGADW
jgi:hypothetical protein